MITFFAILFALLITFLVRNHLTYKFRMEILDLVHKKATEDIYEDREWKWRYETLDEVSYEKILFSLKDFKVENYWKDTKFVE